MQDQDLKEDIKALQYELNEVLEAFLLSNKVDKQYLDEAVDAYIDCIDEVRGKYANNALNALDYIKENFPIYFKPRHIPNESRKHPY